MEIEEYGSQSHRVEQVDQSHAASGHAAVEPTHGQPVGGDSPAGHQGGLGHQQGCRAGPDRQQRREGVVDQFDVPGQPREVAARPGSNQRLPMQHREDRLGHTAQVEDSAVVAPVAR